jgi:hypothetical protein
MGSKVCRACKVNKPFIEYHKDKKVKDGLNLRCKSCRLLKSKQYYEDNRERKKAYQAEYALTHKEAYRANARKWYEKNREGKYRDTRLRRTYGISLEEYNKMLKEQKGVCDICGREERAIHNKSKKVKHLTVDHCHNTGKVRGLLCSTCNTGIGNLQDNIETVEAALGYLTKHKKGII